MYKGLIQVGFISKELERIMDSYMDIYGVGPWYLLKFCPGNVKGMEFYGKKQGYEMDVAVCPIGDVRFEYIEPFTRSIFSDFYDQYGEDMIHHLKFDVRDYQEALDFYRQKGIELIQKGHQQGDKGENVYNFLETTEEFGFITEIVNVTKDFIKPQPDKWVGSERGDFDPIFIRPSVIGIVVKDLDKKLKSYQRFNIGPWRLADFGDKGKLNFTAKMAFCRFGNVDLKLIEPMSDSIFSRDLERYGEGIHHIKMEVDDYDKKLDHLVSKGVGVIDSGTYLDDVRFSFMDTRKHLNFTVQISDRKIKNDQGPGIVIHP